MARASPVAAGRRLLEYLLPSARPRMVGWYDPKVLAQSGWLLAVANVFGRHSDSRLIEALSSQAQGDFRFEADPRTGEFWLDYVSDVGDGWNPTYAIAQAIAASELTVRDAAGNPQPTRGGGVLVFGGDEVYPYPSKQAYAARTEAPYTTAFEGADRRPTVFAVPGNHDWFDSLVAFSRVFCRPERGFAGCPTAQTRSYFALQLPHDWWMLAIDLQLGADMDEPQLRYFREIAAKMGPQSKVILCVPDPQWIYEAGYPDQSSYSDSVLRQLQEDVLERDVSVFLTGDLHFYKRHENAEGVQKIVSGGGGAFLHPTHAPSTPSLPGGFEERAAYPDARTSRRLAWMNLLFPLLNPRSVAMWATVYALLAWFASATLTTPDTTSFHDALLAAVRGAVRDPVYGLWLLAFVAGVVFFTDTHVRWYRVLGGVGHAVAHLCAAFAVAWAGLLVTTRVMGLAFGELGQMLVAAVVTFGLGGLAGAFVLGLYLLISLQIFGRHSNEAFSSLRIQDYKQWLRLCIDREGRLAIHAIGIDRVPRSWDLQQVAESWRLSPSDPAATAPRLIEKIVLTPHSPGRQSVHGIDAEGHPYSPGPGARP
jgi:hypothetical protein